MSDTIEPISTRERQDAERVLAAEIGGVRLGEGTLLEGSDRSRIARFAVLDGPSHLPATVIVKRTLGMGGGDDLPDRPDSPTVRFFNEWAGLQYLGEIGSDLPLAPRLYAGDRDAGLLVMEDLGAVNGFTDVLLGVDRAAAEAALVAWITTIGRLHGQTLSRTGRFRQIRDSLGSPDPGFGVRWIAPTFHAMLDAVDIRPGKALGVDLAALEAVFLDPGDFSAFIHADPCPDNWAASGETHRLIDFEYSRIGHALLDGSYPRALFPTCWCAGRLPERVARKLEATYRAELAGSCIAARDDRRYAQAVAETCTHWMILLCHWFPMADLLREDREWGLATIRQRLLTRLDAVTVATAEARHLETVGELARALSGELHERWDGETEPMPLYPAFQGG